MNNDTIQTHCDPMISALLKIKRGELEQADAIEYLESLKNSIDSLIRAIEFDVTGELLNGGE